MTDNNGWAGRPGVPLNPERDGCHWISLLGGKDNAQVIEWFSDAMCWDKTDWTTEDFGLHARYLGPCLTPAEVDALMEAARDSALEEAAQDMDCACPQRAAVLAKLEKDGPLSHHWPCERSDDCCALRGAAIRALKG
jgi:hypothetical protein